MPNPGVLLSTPDSRYPAKHFEIDGVGTQEEGENKCSSSRLVSEPRVEIKSPYVFLFLLCKFPVATAGVMPSLCAVMSAHVSAASVILVPRAKRHKGGSVDPRAAEKTGPLLMFRFGP